jgi:hypothetical protein
MGGWVGSRAGLDTVEKRTFLTYHDSNSDLLVIQPVVSICYTFCTVVAPGADVRIPLILIMAK